MGLADALNMPYLCTFTERVTSVRHIASTSLSTTMDHLAHFSQLSKFQRAIMMLVAHHTDIDKLEKLKTQFHLLDPKNTGTLEKEDLQQGLKSCKLDMTTARQLEVVLGGSGSSVLKEGQTLNRKQFRAL